jgi:FtsZ-binding cell division protein ZapB
MEGKRVLIILLTFMLMLANTVTARRVLFYEVGTNDQYKIDNGYSDFAQTLRNKGYTVASITRGELKKETLGNYDILVVQELGKSLSTEEISSIIWFVLQQGKGLFINGGGGGKANQLSIPFGVTVDSGVLIDTEDQIGDDRYTFTVNRFDEHPELKTMQIAVTKVGFYRGNGFLLSGNTKCVLRGDDDTYSDTGSFPTGSKPCVAAASLFGNGLVFVYSDVDTLSNKNLNSYNNKNFGLNILDWLSIPTIIQPENQTIQGLQVLIGELKLENAKLDADVKRLTIEKDTLEQQKNQLTEQLAEATQEIYELKSQMIGPFTKSNWALIILGFCIIIAAVVYSKKKAPPKPVEEDVLSELGYELEEGGPAEKAVPEEKPKEEKTGGDELGDLGI